ncbi:putative SWI/SNF-related matrix-associated actin-dependent regulator of chromatin subfamily A member 3-like 1 [Prunus yedoensis var. nudiflora]|uniref:Putative SWI/SNF-related matrix-associated actin-dependent regulator of chromatin subfamily A member 3-like 1 n=1 Tax=Prunus yedoensis var. nudiflora TaxID=2094558 RepID=A0A314ZMF3_PRUYE|nr:putative SWI/SNF-related matrix-associated actin-dependent regulator of chromatin subfamily A member 3-like 1 [Prunus yedoensis var. nudiflora]
MGINLTAASRVYLLDPWWNPAVEEQAMDRVHRIGQKEDVKIVRLIARNSIEERILELQEKRKKLENETLRRGTAKGRRDINFDDLQPNLAGVVVIGVLGLATTTLYAIYNEFWINMKFSKA